jgi:hypothetical protein
MTGKKQGEERMRTDTVRVQDVTDIAATAGVDEQGRMHVVVVAVDATDPGSAVVVELGREEALELLREVFDALVEGAALTTDPNRA